MTPIDPTALQRSILGDHQPGRPAGETLDLEVLRSEIARLKADRDAWREEAWQCYVASGADPDGADARHLNLGEATAAVEDLMALYDEALQGDE